MNLKGFERKLSWPKTRYRPESFRERLWKVTFAGVPEENRTDNLMDMSEERYRFVNPFGH
jgi:hypothetical protein